MSHEVSYFSGPRTSGADNTTHFTSEQGSKKVIKTHKSKVSEVNKQT